MIMGIEILFPRQPYNDNPSIFIILSDSLLRSSLFSSVIGVKIEGIWLHQYIQSSMCVSVCVCVCVCV